MKSYFNLPVVQLISGSVLVILLFYHCSAQNGNPSASLALSRIDSSKPWSERMALSVIKRAPEAWMNDFQNQPQWNYTHGLILSSILKVCKENNNAAFFDYVAAYGDTMIQSDGTIRDYDISEYNIDHVAPGPMLFLLYDKTKNEKYQKAISTLIRQLQWQPVTTEGGYWHKLRYPWQMWLDGLFMGEPFLSEYAMRYQKPELFDKIAHQFILAERHTKDNKTGLLYHAWDESRNQRWSNPETGCSPHFWGRAIGWYCMALVDVLDFFPKDHPKQKELVAILNRTLEAVLKVQDAKTNTWWQVLNYPNRTGNYLESTASSMFTYAMIKGVNQGYLSEKYRNIAKKCYEGVLNTFIRVDNVGEVHLTSCCSVAGLGGKPYRDGSYEYYISEPVRDNDPKGLGPFILASLEFEKSKKSANN